MGLCIAVGHYSEVVTDDESFAEEMIAQLGNLNHYLLSVGLPVHREPVNCESNSWDMFGYSGLHYLRRIAAHLDLRNQLPPPGDKDAPEDPVIREYYRLADGQPASWFQRMIWNVPKKRSFDHLVLHGDAEGYYLPIDFPAVLFPGGDFEIPGGMIGSTHRLKSECERLAIALQLPLNIDPEAEEVWEAAESQGQYGVGWQRYGVESYICLRLLAACEHSLRTGAAIVFC